LDAGAKILFNQASNLRSIEIECNYATMGMLDINDIISKLPLHVKRLETRLHNLEPARIILERVEYLSFVTFHVPERYEFWNGIVEWLIKSGRKATIQDEPDPDHYCSIAFCSYNVHVV
ncbi:unnamed protein product, partial [Rotaria sp. Silwood2]